jgi:hypothetical protein
VNLREIVDGHTNRFDGRAVPSELLGTCLFSVIYEFLMATHVRLSGIPELGRSRQRDELIGRLLSPLNSLAAKSYLLSNGLLGSEFGI